MEKKVLLHQLTRSAFEEFLHQEPNPVAIIALGSIEQHGPHLPLGTDSLCALGVAEEVARKTNSIVVQPCWPGYSPHHMAFKGTITFSSDTLFGIILDTVDSLARHGIRKIMILNAHGGNSQIAAHAARIAGRRSDAVVIVPSSPPGSDEEAKKALMDVDVHAGNRETAAALALFPDLVEMERVEGFEVTTKFPPGVEALRDPEGSDLHIRLQLMMAHTGDTHEFTSSGVYGFTNPGEADADEGRKMLEMRTGQLVKLIEYWKQIDQYRGPH